MGSLRFLTAGESHGRELGVIVEGVPAGLPLTEEMIADDLARRQRGYGRGARQAIERDHAAIASGAGTEDDETPGPDAAVADAAVADAAAATGD